MKETIVAQATAPGRGGIGILRVSGPLATEIAQAVLGKCPKPRMADYLPFTSNHQIHLLVRMYWNCKVTVGRLY